MRGFVLVKKDPVRRRSTAVPNSDLRQRTNLRRRTSDGAARIANAALQQIYPKSATYTIFQSERCAWRSAVQSLSSKHLERWDRAVRSRAAAKLLTVEARSRETVRFPLGDMEISARNFSMSKDPVP